MEWYLEWLKDEQFIPEENETNEKALNRAESMLDRMKQIVERRKEVNSTSQETLKVIEDMKKRIEVIVESCSKDEDHLCDANNETIDQIIELRRKIMEEKIAPWQEKINEYRNDFEMNKQKLLSEKMESSEEKKLGLQREREEERKKKEEKQAI